MGDSAEFEKLTELEARLATALDRIAAGQAAMVAADDAAAAEARAAELAERVATLEAQLAQAPDTSAADAAREEAETRATELSERVNTLEGQLTETQEALGEATQDLSRARADLQAIVPDQDPDADVAALSAMETRLTEAEADRRLLKDALAEKDAELEAQKAELEEKAAALSVAQAALDAAPKAAETPPEKGEADPDVEDMEKALAVMTRSVERAREERDQARKACDRAVDMAEELREAMGATPEDRVLELRRQLRLMKVRAEDLAAQLAIMNSGADSSEIEQGLVSELEALRQLRAADAAELDRIITDVEAGQAAAGGGAHA